MQTAEAVLVGTDRRTNRLPPTFVVGAPRCGTTLVGLHLHHRFRFACFPNAAKKNPRHPYLSAKRALREEGWKPTYESRYGIVAGPLAPSDGWDVLERWFPSYREARKGQVGGLRSLRALVARFEDLYDAPLLCKNNANSMRIAALDEAFPDALFVEVRRELPEAVSSLLEARREHAVPLGKWWSAAPPQHLDRAFASELEQVVATIRGLEDYVAARFAELPAERRLRVDYEAFCADPRPLTEWVREAYARAGVELVELPGPHPERFEASLLPPEVRAGLEREVAPVLERLAGPDDSGRPAF